MDYPAENSEEFPLKYIQIKKQLIDTGFSKHYHLQMIDVSTQILYEQAINENRQITMVNATVSHEMRNPTNSIQAQVQE